jgi:hypothetical protein
MTEKEKEKESHVTEDEKEEIIEEVVTEVTEEVEDSLQEVGSVLEDMTSQLLERLDAIDARLNDHESRFERLNDGRIGEAHEPDSGEVTIDTGTEDLPSEPETPHKEDTGPQSHHVWFRKPNWLNW